MDEGKLRRWVAEGLSLEQIGREVGRHPSTVAYWLEKHRLGAAGREKHAPRGPIGREQLEALVEAGASIAEIAQRLDRSKATVRHWLSRYGLRTRNGVGRRARAEVIAGRAAGAREITMECPTHGATAHRLDARGYFRCLRCRAAAVSRRRRKVKALLVAEFGGRCAVCGFDRSPAALEFHHLDPREKKFGIAEGGLGRAVAALRAEAAKCVLLCSNCHAEVEHGSVTLSGVKASRGASTE